MKLGITKEGYADYIWTTQDKYEITQSQVEEIRDIVKETTGTIMPFKDVLRMVDLFKSFAQDDFKV
jgi:DNA-binding PadR family transcriptional regulator